jgi:hypothetical protein
MHRKRGPKRSTPKVLIVLVKASETGPKRSTPKVLIVLIKASEKGFTGPVAAFGPIRAFSA